MFQPCSLEQICGLTYRPEQSGDVSMCAQKHTTGTALVDVAAMVA